MGIPALFGFLSKHYSDIIIKDKPIIDNIYFDLNCLIHPQCHKIIKENPNWTEKKENKYEKDYTQWDYV